jgi:hypothetical protein
MMVRKNVYQMIVDAAGGRVFVRRDSWRTGVAEVVGSEPQSKEWDAVTAPYYKNPTVYALIKYREGTSYVLEALSSPGTFGYQEVQGPGWWRQGLTYPIRGSHKGKRLELTETGLQAF